MFFIFKKKIKLKKFKKESKLTNGNISLANHLMSLNTPSNGEPSSDNTSERSTTPSSLSQNHYHNTNHMINETPSLSSQTHSQTNLNSIPESHFKEQLQLHVQTIGILVAEKAELQSKLQQAFKKSDKKQEECDELAGRLKASRQKISG